MVVMEWPRRRRGHRNGMFRLTGIGRWAQAATMGQARSKVLRPIPGSAPRPLSSSAMRMVASHNGRPPQRSYPELVVLRCLIVDDNPGFLDAASMLLEQEGVRVVGVASTGAEAVRRAAELRPDVTLLDVDLGTENGFDVARQLLGDPRVDPGHLIFVSAHAEDEFLDLIEASPAIGFLRKPQLSAEAIANLLCTVGDARGGRADTPES